MDKKQNNMDVEEGLSFNVVLNKEDTGEGEFYLAECEELGISDYGETPEKAIEHLKNGIKLLISVEPQKADLLRKGNPLLTARVYL